MAAGPAISSPDHPDARFSPQSIPTCPDMSEDFEFKCARVKLRNERLARWAGRHMGFSGPWLDAYVEEVVTADYDSPGHDDVVRKIAGDFAANGIGLDAEAIRRRIARLDG